MLRRLSLRTRLDLDVISLALVGLVATDVATYSSLQSFLVGRTDRSLDDAHNAVEAGWRGDNAGPPGLPGYYVQVRSLGGAILSSGGRSELGDEDDHAEPKLPSTVSLHEADHGARVAYLTVPATEGGQYRVRAWTDEHSPYLFFVATPLKDVHATLHRLLWIELLVTALVLAGIAVLGLWVVRLGLRPLAAIGDTAAKIAAGDLSRRIERTDERTEGGRRGLALDAVGQSPA